MIYDLTKQRAISFDISIKEIKKVF